MTLKESHQQLFDLYFVSTKLFDCSSRDIWPQLQYQTIFCWQRALTRNAWCTTVEAHPQVTASFPFGVFQFSSDSHFIGTCETASSPKQYSSNENKIVRSNNALTHCYVRYSIYHGVTVLSILYFPQILTMSTSWAREKIWAHQGPACWLITLTQCQSNSQPASSIRRG